MDPGLIPVYDVNLAVKMRVLNLESDRNPMLASLGPIVFGACRPHPDTTDAANALSGVLKRIGTRPPEADPQWLIEFEAFVDECLVTEFEVLPEDTDVSFETWIEGTPYSETRKKELRAVWAAITDYEDKKHEEAKCFVKAETYDDWKFARGIFSRTDAYKCMVGPYFKAIENSVYKRKSFVKHIPVAERPNYIMEQLTPDELDQIFATDYSSFEALFLEKIMRICELKLYVYMTQKIFSRNFFWRRLAAMPEVNMLNFKWFTVFLKARRLSGGMETSLGNGFSNEMFTRFVVKKCGGHSMRIVVEGDDGLFACRGANLTSDAFAKLGLNVKLVRHTDISEASFCGIVFDPIERKTLCDPRRPLSNFGWADGSYSRVRHSKRMRLLRCKALSLAHQYPGAPILWAMAEYGLRMTASYNVGKLLDKDRSIGWWDRIRYMDAVAHASKVAIERPGPRSRLLMERVYGVTIEQQLAIEEYFVSKTDIGPICCDAVNMILPESWKVFFDDYVRKPFLQDNRHPSLPRQRRSGLFESLIPYDNDVRLEEALKMRAGGRRRLNVRHRTVEVLSDVEFNDSVPVAVKRRLVVV